MQQTIHFFWVLRTGKACLACPDFVRGIIYLVGLAIGAAMVSRIAKNLQDYFTSIMVQKLGAKMYADGPKQSLERVSSRSIIF